ncbi:hypothetical protein CP8484711_0059B, partial [Chlamydia psittaci 84-8471/1]
LSNFMQ